MYLPLFLLFFLKKAESEGDRSHFSLIPLDASFSLSYVYLCMY